MSEHHGPDDSSRNLSIMAAAVEHMSAVAASSSEPMAPGSMGVEPNAAAAAQAAASRRAKLVLPNLTQAMQQDIALSKQQSGASVKSSKPLSIGTRPEYTDYQLRGIVTPHPNDVLCGRGGGSNNHPGNESFRELVNEVKVPYVNCPKREKPLIARRIVEAVRNQTPPGRFLSKDSKGMWNDIGDGKAREKTSQALREGAPIIRDMIGKPIQSPSNVANVLKEAKKAERAEKEYGVRLPHDKQQQQQQQRTPTDSDTEDHSRVKSASARKKHHRVMEMHQQDSPLSLPDTSFHPPHQRGTSMGGHYSPPTVTSMRMGSPNQHHLPPQHMPPLKKFRSLGERPDYAPNPSPHRPMGPAGASPWAGPVPQHHQQESGRNYGMPAMPYGHRNMGGYGGPAPPPPPQSRGGPVDYPNASMPPVVARYPPPMMDSVPVDTVRALLLGRIDPVQLALQLLPPEEAAIVARRHAASHGLAPYRPNGGGAMNGGSPPVGSVRNGDGPHHTGGGRTNGVGRGPPPHPTPVPSSHPLPLNPMVSDGSSMSSTGDCSVRQTPSDQYSNSAIQSNGGCDDGSSVDSRQPSQEKPPNGGKKRALPRKKRKYVEEC